MSCQFVLDVISQATCARTIPSERQELKNSNITV